MEITETHEALLLVTAIFLSFGILYFLIDPGVFLITATVGVGAAILGVTPLVFSRTSTRRSRIGFGALFLLLVVPLGYGATQLEWELFSPISLVLLVALAFVFFYYSVFLPLALVNIHRQEAVPGVKAPVPTVSIVVPAYNEEACIGASIQALQATDYPDDSREIIVVDDGSTDRTYEEAQKHADANTTIVQKPNGGKFTALNHGLEHVSGEIVVTVDADSLLEADTLATVAAHFQQDEDLGAIAGNLTVANRGSILTQLQELEYIVGIQLFRRAYDAMRAVIVVPGAFGAFRRDVLEDVGRFDGDTLTEDRDATVKIVKAGSDVRASEALCRTEAPDTWRDLYRQRLRWYRGTVQTLWKHRDVFSTPSYGHLYSLAFPMEAFSAFGVPLIGLAVVVSIVAELVVGSPMRVVSLFAFFTLLQTLVSVLALRLGDDDPKLALYAPLFVLGYRQFLDGVMLKSTLDVLWPGEIGWTSPDRTGTLGAVLEENREGVEPVSSD